MIVRMGLDAIFSQVWRRVEDSSLQLRLTMGIGLVLLLGVGGVTTWTIWDTQRMILNHSEEKLQAALAQISPETDHWDDSPEAIAHLQAAIDQLAMDGLLVWVKQSNGRMLAQSPGLPRFSAYADLVALSDTSLEPQIVRLDDQSVMWCSYPLTVNGRIQGHLYIADDLTPAYAMVTVLNRNLQIVAMVAIALLIPLLTLFIWRALHPLRKTNQLVSDYQTGEAEWQRLDPNELPIEVRELACTCNRLLDRLEAAAYQQRQFTNNVSHELRTPLSLVYGYLQSTLRRSPNLTETQQEALSIAASETEHTIQLLQGLLELARTDHDVLRSHLEPIVVNDVVAEVARMTETFEHRPIVIEAAATPVVAIADRDYLLRVLVHLVDNAVKYSDADQPITLVVDAVGHYARVQVRDRGCGIPPSQQALIFESFHRVDPSRCRSTGGVGLGLSIVKSLVDRMHGTVAVQSEPGQGSTFTITLPLSSARPHSLLPPGESS